jgi:hypothetical protein
MPIAIFTYTYDDFKTAVHHLPRKFVIFYSSVPAAPLFEAWAVSTDMDALIDTGVLNTAVPATFATDFPGAVQMTSASGTPAFPPPGFSSVFTKEHPI